MLLNDIYLYFVHQWMIPMFFTFFSNHLNLHPPLTRPPFSVGWSILLRGQQFWNIGVKGVPFRDSLVVTAGGRVFKGIPKTWWVFWGNPMVCFFSNLTEIFGDIFVFCVLLRLFSLVKSEGRNREWSQVHPEILTKWGSLNGFLHGWSHSIHLRTLKKSGSQSKRIQ